MSTLPEAPDGYADRWTVTVYPTAQEAWVTRPLIARSRLQSAPPAVAPVLDIRAQLDVRNSEPETRNDQSLRRSRGRIRRYAVANNCNVLVTPTYAPEHLDRATDRERVELDVRNLVRFMRSRWGEPFPYVSMPELQPERSREEGVGVYNGMVLVPRMPRAVFDAVIAQWPYGQGDGYNGVDITRWRSKRGGAGYASKALSRYAGKGLGAAPPGGQSYRVGQGFQPVREVTRFRSDEVWEPGDALEVVGQHYGASGMRIRSADDDSWVGAWAIW